MPLYDYKCENGHVFEEMQSFSSEPIATCGDCGTSAKRQLSVPMVLYKGSGFYTTDYGRNGSASRSNSDADGDASGIWIQVQKEGQEQVFVIRFFRLIRATSRAFRNPTVDGR